MNARVYARARYYAPELRRFISADTIVPQPGNPQAFGRYAYTYQNPVNLIDPTGHCSYSPEYGHVETCTSFNEIQDAELFLAFINAYLHSIEYDYKTTQGMLQQWVAGEVIEDIGGLIGNRLGAKSDLAGEIGSKVASFLQAFDETATEEGLKTLRRFRDDFTSAIESMSQFDDAMLSISILGQSLLNPFSRNDYSGGGAYHIQVMRRMYDEEGTSIVGSDKISGYFHQSGGPFNGLSNNFANLVQGMMLHVIPENGGRVNVNKYFTSLTVTQSHEELSSNFGWFTFASAR